MKKPDIDLPKVHEQAIVSAIDVGQKSSTIDRKTLGLKARRLRSLIGGSEGRKKFFQGAERSPSRVSFSSV